MPSIQGGDLLVNEGDRVPELPCRPPVAEGSTSARRDDGEPAPKRPRSAFRASSACQACRKRKAKCDNAKPKCTRCVQTTSDCIFDHMDGRRIPQKSRMQEMQAKLEALERAHLPSLSMMSQSNPSANGIARLSTTDVSPAASSSHSGGSFALSEDASSSTFVTLPSEDSLASTLVTAQRDLDSILSGSETPNVQKGTSPAAQISGRQGRMSMADGGQLRWYGATSNRHLSFGRVITPGRLPPGELNQRCRQALARLNTTEDVYGQRLEERLLQLYFVWQDPFFHIVDREVFTTHRQRYVDGNYTQCHFFSLSLYYAILAYAAHLSDQAITLSKGPPEGAGDAFMARARICLDEEMDSPQETTVQALAIMAAREVGCGRDARGWLYIGMAAGCAIDLGLHTDATEIVQRGDITIEQFRVRNVVWWGSYCYEKLWGLYVGRPSSYTSRDIQTPHPSALGGESLAGSLVLLLQITDKIVATLYSGSAFQALPDALASWVAGIQSQLNEWLAALSPKLSMDLELQPLPSPEVITLHLQYHATLILLHRTFVCESNALTTSSKRFALKTCYSSATAAAHLLDLYRRLFTFRRMSVVAPHQIFTVATMLVFLVHAADSSAVELPKSDPPVGQVARRSLLVCLGAMSALAVAQAHAKRCYLQVIMLMKRWEVSLDVLPSQSASTERNPPPVPKAPLAVGEDEQFETLSRELFELSGNTGFSWSGMIPSPDIFSPPIPTTAGDTANLWPPPFGIATPADAEPSFGAGGDRAGASHDIPPPEPNLTLLDFFNVGGDEFEFGSWGGPSLSDMFSHTSFSASPFPSTSN